MNTASSTLLQIQTRTLEQDVCPVRRFFVGSCVLFSTEVVFIHLQSMVIMALSITVSLIISRGMGRTLI
jgi:hypothetical protein